MTIGIAVGYEKKRRPSLAQIKGAKLEDAARKVVNTRAPERADSNTSMAREQKRVRDAYRMVESIKVPSSDRFNPSQVQAQILLLAKARARENAKKSVGEDWGK